MIAEKTFRQDLFYRLNVIGITLPALRHRREDIILLIKHFLAKYENVKPMEDDCLKALVDYSWPGNVRELENEIERITILCGDKATLSKDFLSDRVLQPADPIKQLGDCDKLKDAVSALEEQMIRQRLTSCGGNQTQAAKSLGISRSSLVMKIARYNI